MIPLAAVILAAGVGKRLAATLGSKPKALLEVGSESLLQRLVRQLRAARVERIAVVVGFGAEQVRAALAGLPGVVTIDNPEFRRGAILSLWAARDFLDGPVLVMDADVFAPDELVARLVDSPKESCFLLDGRVVASGEEQMLMVRGERVCDIARRPRGEFDLLGESVGFLKLSGDAARVLRELLRARVARGEVDIEHEEAYPELLGRVAVGFERVDDLDWTEVDFAEDVERAQRLAAREGRRG
jgi:choline kinase